MTDDGTKLTDLAIKTSTEPKQELSAEFWLQFPICARPLKFVPGRNRREKRMFRALADQQERGTISRGRRQRGQSAREGGNLNKLQQLYALLAATGNARMSDPKEEQK